MGVGSLVIANNASYSSILVNFDSFCTWDPYIFGFLQDNSSVEWGLYHGESGRSLLGKTK